MEITEREVLLLEINDALSLMNQAELERVKGFITDMQAVRR